MKMPQTPRLAVDLLKHLACWGEVSKSELGQRSENQHWAESLETAGIVERVPETNGQVEVWSLAAKGECLLDLDDAAAAKMALFQVPPYRSYLLGILAEGLALAAQAKMQDRLEGWTGGELGRLLPEINVMLDQIDRRGDRLVDQTREQIHSRCATLPERNGDFTAWDQELLGLTARPQDLFDVVLRKFAPLATLGSATASEAPCAVLRPLPLNDEDGFVLGEALRPQPWSIQRRRIHSGVGLFSPDGDYLHNPDLPVGDVLKPALQDALVDHPFYKAVVHLAICAWRSPAADTASLELVIPPTGELHEVSILVDGRSVGLLSGLLCRLVEAQGVRTRGITDGIVPPPLLGNLLRNLLTHHVLRQVDDELELHPQYQASLVAERLRSVLRPGKAYQQAMLDILQDVASRGDGLDGKRAES